ncbi:unnamed protein product (macronuclear) [Paramecium tetraurelia]|uniref:Uncharacterized protein n=1 Tax=Paramecium tetraurelia TaxID=5888 RepID=A0DUL5_PARTE|nr:uncharacterized protein GSPATT00020404001 [Paramecium tetraurelia]CAK86732.1 unnamed protein product [Paramecium tetraurelia]|eukprot:XP_001454129.1 hypothetical protein (macronuclear) [Paramecium tetraurelia strain d4-2]
MRYSPASQQYGQAYGYSQPQQSVRPPYQSYKPNDNAQSHTVTHPHVREMYHREAPITVVTRDEIESVWKAKCSQLEQALTECQTEVMRLRGIGATEKITYVEDTLKINQLYLEIDRLNKCLLDMSLELDQYKHKLYMATDKQARQQAEIDIDKMRAIMVENEAMLNAEIVRLRDQNEELSKRYRILELSMADSRHQLSLKEYEATLSQLRQEIDRAQFSINSQRAETEEWKLKYQRLEAQLRDSAQYEVEIRRLKEMVDNRNREIESLKLNSQFENDGKLQNLQLEIERLQNELRQKNYETNRLRSQIQQQESTIKYLNSKISELDNKILQMKSEYDSLKANQLSYKPIIQSNNEDKEQIDRLRSQIQQMNIEIEDWKSRYNELDKMYQDLEYEYQNSNTSYEEVTKLTNDVQIWKNKFQELNREYHQVQEELVVTSAELDSLKKKQNELSKSGVRSSAASYRPGQHPDVFPQAQI